MQQEYEAGPELRAKRGIVDVDSGLEVGRRALQELRAAAAEEVGRGGADLTITRMVLLGLLARAEAFHRGVLTAIEQNNPFTTFTLLRSYSENAAMLVWLQNAPERISQLDFTNPHAHGPKIGRIVQAAQSRLRGFGAIYEQLSTYAHPAAGALLVSWTESERETESGAFEWSTVPKFKRSIDAEMACFWLVELAEANQLLWVECHRIFESLPAESLGRMGGLEHNTGAPA